jgi:hypothetical protein
MAVVPSLIGLVPSNIPFTFSICQGHAQLKWPALQIVSILVHIATDLLEIFADLDFTHDSLRLTATMATRVLARAFQPTGPAPPPASVKLNLKKIYFHVLRLYLPVSSKLHIMLRNIVFLPFYSRKMHVFDN